MGHQVVIKFGNDGSVKAEVKGVTGSSCKDKTEWLNPLYGAPDKVTLKPSYYQEDESKENLVDGLPSGHCG